MAEKLNRNVNVPIQRTNLSLFDETVSGIKEKFIAEMKRMDEEMDKFSSDLVRAYAQTPTLSPGTASPLESVENQSAKSLSHWESLASSPLVEVDGEAKTLKLQFDVSHFDPAEVTVKVMNETLVISASHEEKSDNSSQLRQYYREFRFPKGVDPATINSTLSKDGVLTVKAPLPQQAITDTCGERSPKT